MNWKKLAGKIVWVRGNLTIRPTIDDTTFASATVNEAVLRNGEKELHIEWVTGSAFPNGSVTLHRENGNAFSGVPKDEFEATGNVDCRVFVYENDFLIKGKWIDADGTWTWFAELTVVLNN